MTGYAPITLRVLDENGSEMFSQIVPYDWEIDVKELMERAFILSQSSTTPDPLVYTLQYYGYSERAQFPGYLGYEVESIGTGVEMKPNNSQFYWQLLIDGLPSQEGADSEQPRPGSTITWQYTPIPPNSDDFSSRTRLIHSRRAKRQPLLKGTR
jgi:hypothetical protein